MEKGEKKVSTIKPWEFARSMECTGMLTRQAGALPQEKVQASQGKVIRMHSPKKAEGASAKCFPTESNSSQSAVLDLHIIEAAGKLLVVWQVVWHKG